MSATCFIIAGPNGAGKTTFAETYLPADVRRRFHRSWANFQKTYRALADEGIIFDNTGNDRIVLEEW